MSIHFAKLENSERLQRIYRLLQEVGPRGATSREIDLVCDTVCAHTGIAELRANRKKIATRMERETRTGRRVFRYILDTSSDKISCPVCGLSKKREAQCDNPACGCFGETKRVTELTEGRRQLNLL